MKKTTLLLSFLIWGMASNLLTAQDLTGIWHGLLDVQAAQLRLDLDIAQQDGKYTVMLYSPDQTPEGIPVPEVDFKNGKLDFAVPEYTIEYTGTVDKGFAGITGTFKQGGQAWPLNFSREALDAPPGSPEWIKARLDKQEIYITMRDGVRLFTSIYTPKDTSKKYPMLMTRTPYNIEPNGEEGISYHLMSNVKLIEEGYIFVYQDVRGRHMSEGEYMDVRPYNPKKNKNEIDETTDTYDAIDWLVKNVAGNNGRIGVFGVSYPGFYSTMSLIDAHPALKAVSPQAPVTNWFIGDDFHHNGAFALMDGFSFYSGFGKPRPKPTREGQPGYDIPGQDNYDFYLKMGALKHAKEIAFGDSIKFWTELMNHPDYDDFWKARDPRPHLKNIKPAVLTVGGHFDAEDCWGAWHTYEAIEKQNPATVSNRLIMGPWSHGQWSGDLGEQLGNIHFGANTGDHYKEVELEFFNFYLKDKGKINLPEADIFITGANKWQSFDTWPPKNVTEKTLYFQSNGSITMSAPTAKTSFDEYVSDPMKPVPYTEDVHLRRTREYMTDDQRFAARRPDVMVYQTDILTEDMTITGPLNADLFVSTTGTDADFVVKLIDVFPDTLKSYPKNDMHVPMAGYQMLVRGEIFRGRYRNSYEKPEAFVPGKVTEVKYELPDVAHTFKKGHRIMVQVQNSWFPLFDRNPQQMLDIYHCSSTDFKKATMRIYHEAGKASGVKVKVLR
ncbi:MAG: CocE/NonD family hydrolase [Saprospiraceae bacterium]|nr:CocE/NonD family hydrolase [Saprospiraceae bacterium]MCF8250040.1 CocE/NonD family hydrolase [Saprospiraceae bacterium]MCF8278920.1 CocE/NonD family hydrolase [Bacteroidales bacterium]MCF8311053.1 CocE/NonD family hydrolase [Saprospiraceae bacterium]MCF8439611.1 CocE/NonD family hydrolase [Saprospiraceae bacterium]